MAPAKLRVSLLLAATVTLLSPPVGSASRGVFWQVSDFHYDPKYSTVGDTAQMCHDVGKPSSPPPGMFGDYHCDAPWRLVEEAVEAMARIEKSPDFIVWTGDDPPHVPVSTLNFDIVLGTVVNATRLIKQYFPNTQVFPALGNHDFYPKGQMPPYANPFYSAVAKEWVGGQWIANDAASTFKLYGYYTMVLPGNSKLRFVCLNTVFYYEQDKVTANMTDPGGQFVWFDNVMNNARANDERVYVFGHVPPGMFERKANVSWFYPHYNRQFINAVSKHSDVIAAQFFAHEHADSFRVFYSNCSTDTGECQQANTSMFIAPSVTPWQTTLPGVSAQNPAIRIYEYDRASFVITNIHQYHLDVAEANAAGKPNWVFGYSARDDYNLDDLSTKSLDCLVQSFKEEKSPSFALYYTHTTAGFVNNTPCDDDCKRTQVCSIARSDFDQYFNCLDGIPAWPSTMQKCRNAPQQSSSQLPAYAYILIAAGVALAIVLITVVIWLKKRKSKSKSIYKPLLESHS